MAQTPEGKVKAKIRVKLDAWKVYYFMPPANGYGRTGIPDFIICVNSRFVAIEAKAGKGKTTALQDRELHAIFKAGGVSLVVNEDNLHVIDTVMTALGVRRPARPSGLVEVIRENTPDSVWENR
jgi:hypothetical protein